MLQVSLGPGLQRLIKVVFPLRILSLNPVILLVQFQKRLKQMSSGLTDYPISECIYSALIFEYKSLKVLIDRIPVKTQSSVTFCFAVPATASWCCRIPIAIYIPNIVDSINDELFLTIEDELDIFNSEICFLVACKYLPKSLTKPLRATLEVK